MRCKQCGWENPAENVKCEKCGSALDVSDNPAFPAREPFSPKGTVSENEVFQKKDVFVKSETVNNCEKCGYLLSAEATICPQCGTVVRSGKDIKVEEVRCEKCNSVIDDKFKFCPNCGEPVSEKKEKIGTINNWKNPEKGVFCTLKPIAWDNETVKYEPVSYSGDKVTLNRANLDPNNNTITSKKQAVLLREGEDWYIMNGSEQKTTFVQVKKKVKLENGDVILLGNRMFEFKA